MAGYQIDLAKMKSELSKFETVLQNIEKEMKSIDKTRTSTLSDAVFKGPNKVKYEKALTSYQQALSELYKNAVEHYDKLVMIVKDYSTVENS